MAENKLIKLEILEYYDEKLKAYLQNELNKKAESDRVETLEQIVPAPTLADSNSFLRGDGKWATIEQVTINNATDDTFGIVKGGEDVTIVDGLISIKDNSHNHTAENITDLEDVLDGYVSINTTINNKPLTGDINLEPSDIGAISEDILGTNGGVATLDENGHIPASMLPSYVDDVIEVANYDALPNTGESGKIYVSLDNGKTYRWGGTNYVEISASLTLGETDSTAFAGNRGLALETKVGVLESDNTTNKNNIVEIQETIDELQNAITNAEGSVKTISINNGVPLTPDENKNINIDLSEYGAAYDLATEAEIDALFSTNI